MDQYTPAAAWTALSRRPVLRLALIVAAVVLALSGGVVGAQAATRNPCEKYSSFSDDMNGKYGTYDDVEAGLARMSADAYQKLNRLHVACNDYDDAHPGAWDDAVWGHDR